MTTKTSVGRKSETTELRRSEEGTKHERSSKKERERRADRRSRTHEDANFGGRSVLSQIFAISSAMHRTASLEAPSAEPRRGMLLG